MSVVTTEVAAGAAGAGQALTVRPNAVASPPTCVVWLAGRGRVQMSPFAGGWLVSRLAGGHQRLSG